MVRLRTIDACHASVAPRPWLEPLDLTAAEEALRENAWRKFLRDNETMADPGDARRAYARDIENIERLCRRLGE